MLAWPDMSSLVLLQLIDLAAAPFQGRPTWSFGGQLPLRCRWS
jgi:hypothetical protein